jgi:hypothetical protein
MNVTVCFMLILHALRSRGWKIRGATMTQDISYLHNTSACSAERWLIEEK